MTKKRILIVDDVEALRKQAIYSLAIIYPNVSFIEASNGFEALDKVIKHKPDLILLDIDMPKMNGIDVLKRIRRSKDKKIKKLPIIMFTGTVDKDTVEEIVQLGVSGYLVKPFEIDALLEKVDTFLNTNE